MFSKIIVVFANLGLILQQFNTGVIAKPNQVTMPEECLGKNYCTVKAKHYPQEEINKILSVLKIKQQIEVGQRSSGPAPDDLTLSLCPNIPVVDAIYQIIDNNGDVRYVIQSKGLLEQKSYIRECEMPGPMQPENARDIFDEDEIEQYNVSCTPLYTLAKYLVLTHDKKGVEMASPKGGLPAWCVCKYNAQNTVN